MNKIKLKTAIVVVLFVILSTVSSFAAPTVFTDISGHWAREYIEDVYERRIIEGYSDATFKPEGEITKPEAIVMVAKLMGYSDSEEGYYISECEQKLENNNIPNWAEGAVAYALFNDILLDEELESLASISDRTYARRHEVATYIGRVLHCAAGIEPEKVYRLPYIDEMSIPDAARVYINLLLDEGILDGSSNDGRFLPDGKITRAEAAKLVSLSAEILDNVSDDDIIVEPDSPVIPPTDTVRETVKGYIDNIISGDRNIISVESKGSRLTYEIDSKADITIDGKVAAVEQLESGQEVTVIIENDTAVDVEAFSNKEVLKGRFYYYLQGQDPKVFIRDSKDNTCNLSFTADSEVYFKDRAVHIEDLNTGDAVIVTYADDKIIKIEAEPREKIFEGVVKAKNDSRDEYSLEVLLDDETLEIFSVPSEATLRRDRRSVRFGDIKVGDEVEITMEYEIVASVNAFSVKRIVEGYIEKIVIGQRTEPTKITVEKFDETVETFKITPDTVIRVEGKRAGIYDLRLNYEVELEIENDEVLWVETYRSFQGSVYVGKATYIDARRGILEFQVRSREEIEVYVDNETIYNDEFGDWIELRDIYVGDEIVVVVEDDGYDTVAKRVIVIIGR